MIRRIAIWIRAREARKTIVIAASAKQRNEARELVRERRRDLRFAQVVENLRER